MLTPAFEIQQQADYLIIVIKAPFAKISETEIYIEENEFKFYSKPYYLRLNLPGAIVEDGRECADYDSDTGTFTVQVPKVVPGQHFEGLDMISKLLAPIGLSSPKQPNIEVLDSEVDESLPLDYSGEYQGEEEEFDWQIEQTPFEETAVSLEAPRYGFGCQRSDVFGRLQAELCGVIDLKDADSTPWWQRRELRLADEKAKFDDDHYLADFYQDEVVRQLLEYQPIWAEEYKQIHGGAHAEDIVQITKEEREQMRKLPRKDYLLDDREQHSALLGLVDIIFAFAFNHRTTEGENTVESGWTICKLSGTLSWLETYKNLKDVIVTSYRRCLCYPLHRHWKLTNKVLRDVQKIFLIGRHRLLKCLLEIHQLLQDCELRYVLNDLYITGYCVWLQSVSETQLKSLARNLAKTRIKKRDVGLDLVVLEQAGALAAQEEENATEITAQVAAMSVEPASKSQSIDSSVTDSADQGASLGSWKSGNESEVPLRRTASDLETEVDDLDLSSSTDSETSDSTDDSDSSSSDTDTENDTDSVTSDPDALKVASSVENESSAFKFSAESDAAHEGNLRCAEQAVQQQAILDGASKARKDSAGLESGESNVDNKSLNF